LLLEVLANDGVREFGAGITVHAFGRPGMGTFVI
jgi:hypothetical protein